MNTNRRNFIKASSLAFGSLIFPETLLKTKPLIQDSFHVRKSANTPEAAADIELYRKAVQEMKRKPPTDPKSWEFQARIHNNFCPHQNWFFLPWHRAYLKHFEELCREACGDSKFNLPYWDWTEYPQIPAPFWGNNNVLFDKTRVITASSVALNEFIGRDVLNDTLKTPSFEDFASYRSDSPDEVGGQGKLEGSLHNYIHRFVKGNMETFMSPRDPIFWLHHANVDRIWATWNDNGNSNPANATFNNFILKENFYNVNGKVDVRIGDMFDVRKLGYEYDTQKTIQPVIASSTFSLNTILKSAISNTKLIKKLQPARFELESQSFLSPEIKTLLQSNTPVVKDKQAVKVILSEIQPPQDEDFFVRVFLNCDYLDKNTPINDPHYVGSFTFFASTHSVSEGMQGMNHSMHGKTLKFVLDITETLGKVVDVSTIDSIQEKVKVQLLSIPLNDKSAGSFLPGKIEIVVASREG